MYDAAVWSAFAGADGACPATELVTVNQTAPRDDQRPDCRERSLLHVMSLPVPNEESHRDT